MAATARASERDAHGLYGPVPGSPTLTNPDMILPDYEIPDSPGNRLHSPLELWNDPNIGRMDFQLPPQNYGAGAMGPSTPIIYGNGTMLSDIGEVTEVESTVGPGSRRTSSRYSLKCRPDRIHFQHRLLHSTLPHNLPCSHPISYSFSFPSPPSLII